MSDLADRFNPKVAEAIRSLSEAPSGLSGLLGITLKSMQPGKVVCALPIRPELHSAVGLVHGGAISALIDHTLSITVYPLVEPGKWVATLEFKVNYLSAVSEGEELVATGHVVSLRKRTAVVRVDVEVGDRQVAVAQGTLYVRDPAGGSHPGPGSSQG